MKLIKRNGSEEVFAKEKIAAAIIKANEAVDEDERITNGKINKIASHVEAKCEKLGRAVSVEEIQDMVEMKLMKSSLKQTAKEYITYREKRSQDREKYNTFLKSVFLHLISP